MDQSFSITDKLVVYDAKTFRAYLRANKITKENFILNTFKKKDLYDGDDLIFKNEDQYFNNDFNSRANLIDYFINCNDPLSFCLSFFSKRKSYKNLVYAPSQVELKSFIAPSINVIEKREIDYNQLMKLVSLKSKYDYSIKILDQNKKELIIIQDTREQRPLKFNVKTEVSKLDSGDYSCLAPHFSNVFIERKSLNDFVGTLSSKNFERFKSELARAKNLNQLIFIIIESPLSTALKFNTLDYNFSRVSPEFIFHNMRELIQEFDNCQFLFVNSRAESSRVIEKIFRSGEQIKKCDIQYLYEKGIL